MHLTIGMPSFMDANGVYFSIQHARMLDLPGQTEFLVVDQAPDSPHGIAVKGLIEQWVHGNGCTARYVPYTEKLGSAAAKEKVFQEAAGKNVICMDGHVLLWPGTVQSVLDNLTKGVMVVGPMVYDNYRSCSTHLDKKWSGEQWGTWAEAFRCKCGAPNVITIIDGRLQYSDAMGQAYGETCKCGNYVYPQQGKSLDQCIGSSGFSRYTDGLGPNFLVGAHGTGFMAMRKEDWPGFPEGMAGFGAEEWIIHERLRRKGGDVICVPGARWTHRFLNPDGPKYPLHRWDKVRNFVIGFRDVGLDLDPIHEHFVASGLMSEVDWQRILQGAPEMQPAKPGCGGCGAKFSAPPTLEGWYEVAKNAPSDCNEHVPDLRELATGARRTVVFGGRHGITTVAVLAAQPEFLTIVDPAPVYELGELQRLAGRTTVDYIQARSENYAPGDEIDFAFICTRHTAEQLSRELAILAPVTRTICLNGTEIFGDRGEDGGPGLLFALRQLCKDDPRWTVVNHKANNYGFTVLTRDAEARPALPGMARMAWNYATAYAKHVAAGAPVADETTVKLRLDTCALCPLRTENRCSKCGCYLDSSPDGKDGKALWKDQECPLGHWQKAEDLGHPIVPMAIGGSNSSPAS